MSVESHRCHHYNHVFLNVSTVVYPKRRERRRDEPIERETDGSVFHNVTVFYFSCNFRIVKFRDLELHE
jgi:hypothetical protein